MQTFKEEFKLLAQAWQAVAENSTNIAYSKRQLFNAYVSEGFTEAQAIELIKTI